MIWRYKVRKFIMWVMKRHCGTCVHYDGRFGEECCFECERSIAGDRYERRGTEEIF